MTMQLSSSCLRSLGIAIRVFVVAIYFFWIVVGYCHMESHRLNSANFTYNAVYNLPVGHRLRAVDLQVAPKTLQSGNMQLPPESDLIGKYLLQDRIKGQSIGPADVTAAPLIDAMKGEVAYFFSLQNQAQLSDILNTNSRVAVCAEICAAPNARVISIVCDGPASSKCSAVLELSQMETKRISGKDKSSYRLVLRAI